MVAAIFASSATVPALESLGYKDAASILSEPVVDADTIARYTDSIFNSCVPLGRGDHSGVLPAAAGVVLGGGFGEFFVGE